MTRAVFLGRFQPLHLGHKKVIEKYREEFEDLILGVGSSSKQRDEENPLSFEEREEMIKDCFPDLEVIGLEDEERTEEGNRIWSEKIAEKTDADVLISGNELVQHLVEEHTSMEVVEPEMHDPDIYSGTEVRRRIRAGEEWRYLVPKCSKQKIEELEEAIKESGINYEFNPGWKKENAFHGTAEE